MNKHEKRVFVSDFFLFHLNFEQTTKIENNEKRNPNITES